MSLASDQEMSECSNSPASYKTLGSPSSSPAQQVPQLTAKLPKLSFTDNNLYNSKGNIPYLRITEQPQKHFRFRYSTEKSGSTHGSILGRNCVDKKTKKKASNKTHPSVQLVNYSGEAVIRCSIKYDDNDKNVHKNIYKILEDEQDIKSFKVPVKNIYEVAFRGIGVLTYKQSDLVELLYSKLLEAAKRKSDEGKDLYARCKDMAKTLKQNAVRLKFTAHDLASGKEICDPVLSDAILNNKSAATNALKIFRTSLRSGRLSGGEDIFLLVDKIDKTDTRVRFYEEDKSGKRVWSEWATFTSSDVHFQYAIVCRTPVYSRNRETPVDVDVFIELVRTSNGSTSDPQPFMYKADQVQRYGKRRRIATPTRFESFSGVSLSSDQAPVIVLSNDPNEFMFENNVSLQAPSTPVSQWNIISSSQGVLSDAPGQALEPQETSPMWGPCYSINQTTNVHAQTTMQYPAEIIAAPNTQPFPVEFSFTALNTLQNEAEFGIAAAPTSSVGLGINVEPGQSFTKHVMPNDVLIEDNTWQFIENDLAEEWNSMFGVPLTDIFDTSNSEANNLVGDSGRVKVTTSSTQTDDAVSEEDVLRYQGGIEVFIATGVNQDEITSQSRESQQATRGSLGEVAGASNAEANVNKTIGLRKFRAFFNKTSKNENCTTKNIDEESVLEPQMDTTPHIISASEFKRASPREQIKLLLGETIEDENQTIKNSDEAKDKFLLASEDDENDVLRQEAITRVSAMTKTSLVATEGNEDAAGSSKAFKAASKGDGAGASECVDVGADIDYPFFSAKDADEVKVLVRELCEVIRDKKTSKSEVASTLERLFDIRLSNGDTFLHMTLFKSQRSFEALIKMISSVKIPHLLNYANNRGETILHLAVVQGTPELVSLLVAKGCDPMVRNCENETAVHYAVRYAGESTLRALLQAARRAGVPLDLDAPNAERQSALHLCVVEDSARCASVLCGAGAACGARDAAGRTPLHLCAYDARVEVARALLAHGAAHVDAADAAGRTPLAVACERQRRAPSPAALELARALLAAGARADRAWRAARDHAPLADLLRAHLTAATALLHDDLEPELDDVKSELDDTDTDEYESADDEYVGDATPESLSCKLEEMALTDDGSV